MPEEILNGTAYGVTGLIFEIKRGATWKETFFFEGDLSGQTLRGYIARKKDGERLAEFTFSTPTFGDFVDEDGNPLDDFTTFEASLSAEVTEDIPPTNEKPLDPPRAGRDFWECDFESVQGATVTHLLSAIVHVTGQC